jgi:hypothetical protein
MRKLIAVMSLGLALSLAGCESWGNKDKDQSGSGSEPKMMADDVCSHCSGKQTMTAEGKCSGCGMMVRKS